MAVCEDAPCCGCCGQIAWAREDQAMAESFMDWQDRVYDDYGPDHYDPSEYEDDTESDDTNEEN